MAFSGMDKRMSAMAQERISGRGCRREEKWGIGDARKRVTGRGRLDSCTYIFRVYRDHHPLRVLRVLRLRNVFNVSAGAHIALARFSSRTASSFVSPAKAMHSAVSSRHLVVLLKWIAVTPQSGCSRGFRHG
eukprot:scaffold42038_cov73-Phaeocystis_antarctica.AAC.2